jgi:C_GCAxxG_C_C family probable redox protein
MNRAQRALSEFSSGFNCSQSVLSVFAEDYGLDTNSALKLATGFGGGMGGTGRTCGAVSGAFLVIGLKYGNVAPGDTDSKNATYRRVREFIQKFEAKNRSIQCKELLDLDLSTPEGLASARERGLFTAICPRLVSDAVEILEAIMQSDGT